MPTREQQEHLRLAARQLRQQALFSAGAFIGGVASGSLHGWIWFAVALPGCMIGIKLRPLFGLSRERAGMLPDGALVMHPGPMNRGVEIDSDVADLPQAVIEEQVTNGIAVRMSLLYLLLGGSGSQAGGSADEVGAVRLPEEVATGV